MPDEAAATPFHPRVKGATTAFSTNVASLLGELDDGTYYVPDYQRDSSQWDLSKKSLFIDSLINNMTVPPLILYPETDSEGSERHQIIDGQQRLTTIRDFIKGGFALAPEAETEYAENIGPLVQGRRFAELPETIKQQIQRYKLNFIVLPKDLELSLRLEIFRYYVIARDVANVETLLGSTKAQDAAGVRYDRTTISVLDLYLAQLQNESDGGSGAAGILAGLETMKGWFVEFETWFNAIKTAKVPRISTNSSTKVALFIAAAIDVWGTPDKVTEPQWELIQVLLTQGPRAIEDAIGLSYPIPKGKWPGQRTQIAKTVEACQAIARR